MKLDNGQTESISNEYIQLELDSSIKELPSPGIAYGAFCVGSSPHKSRLYKAGIGLEYNVRLSQETWEKLNSYAVNEGTASLDGAISLTAWLRNARLLDLVDKS